VERLRLAADLAEERGEKTGSRNAPTLNGPMIRRLCYCAPPSFGWAGSRRRLRCSSRFLRQSALVSGGADAGEYSSRSGSAGYAYRLLEEAFRNVAPGADALRALAELASATGRDDQEIVLYGRLLGVRFDDLGARRAIVADALERARSARSCGISMTSARSSPEMPGRCATSRAYTTRWKRRPGIIDLPGGYRDRAEDADTWVAYGCALLRAEHREGAAEAFARRWRYDRRTPRPRTP